MDVHQRRRRFIAVLLALTALLAIVPAPALADERIGGDVVVASGETVEGDLRAVAGRVIIRGTVTGDLKAAAGSVIIEGEVQGDVEVAAGSLRISGTVGDSLEAGAGSVVISGTVGGDATIGADSIAFLDDGRIAGNLRYDAGTVTGLTAETVGGTATEDSDIRGPFSEFGMPNWIFAIYGFAASLVLAVLLYGALPSLSAAVTETLETEPLRSAGYGLLALVGWPIAMALVAITIVGIPVAIVGLLLYVVALWVGWIYGSGTLGQWLLATAGFEHGWGGIILGLVLVALVGLVPIIGGFVQFLVLLFGLGALAWTLGDRARSQRRPE